MGMPAARLGDLVLQDAPHCHAPIHPPAPIPTPAPHPALPLPIVKGLPTVLIGGKPAARATDITKICTLPACVPGGPGMLTKCSMTVLIGGLPGRASKRYDKPSKLRGADPKSGWESTATRLSNGYDWWLTV